jgi:dihydrofolate reductase
MSLDGFVAGPSQSVDNPLGIGGSRDVALAGGARAAPQYLAADLIDEMEINVVPTLLGSGERMFEAVGDDLHGLELVRTVAAPNVTHLKFARR